MVPPPRPASARPPPRLRRRLSRLLASPAAWMVFFLSWSVQGVMHAFHPGALAPREDGGILLLAAADVLQAALLAVVCYALAAGALSRRLGWPRVTVFIVLAAGGLPLARLAALAVLARVAGAGVSPRALVAGFPGEFLVTAGFLGLGFTFAYAAGSQARDLALERMERELALARLQALQAQLHPHFLFNAFNSIAALMHRDVEAADRMLARLGELLRRLLRRSEAQLVTLDEELEFVGLYLEVERVRFGERLRVEVEATPQARAAVVPHLLLQPLVENAVRHGIAPAPGGGRLEIRAHVDAADTLHVEVRDTGRGLPPGWAPGRGGIGLANVRTRLEHLYDGRHHFALESPEDGGVRVRLRLPAYPPPGLVQALGAAPNLGDDFDADPERRPQEDPA